MIVVDTLVDPVFEDVLRNLRGFSATGGTSNDDAGVFADLVEDLLAELKDRKSDALFAHSS